MHRPGRAWVAQWAPESSRTPALFTAFQLFFRRGDIPSNIQWQRDLSVSYIKLGGVLEREGQLDKARQRYEQSLALCEKLSAVDPSNIQWQRDLLVSHMHSLLLSLRMRQGAEARRHHAAARAIVVRFEREHLLVGDPGLLWARQKLSETAKFVR